MTRAINVWAWQEQLATPGSFQRSPVCSDASESTRRMGPAGRWVGQAGWHFALPFASLDDLVSRLARTELPDYIPGEQRTLQRGEVQTLAIDCHGSDGIFYPNGVPGIEVGANNLDEFAVALRKIGMMTAAQTHDALLLRPPNRMMERGSQPASSIIFMSCNTGAGPRGTRLLEQLSYRWPGRRVVGFSTTVVIPRLVTVADPASGEACVAPFSLDSGVHGMRSAQVDDWMDQFRATHGQDPSQLPFADAGAANAKIARDGRIVDFPANEPRRHTALQPQLTGPPRGNTARPTIGRGGVRRVV